MWSYNESMKRLWHTHCQFLYQREKALVSQYSLVGQQLLQGSGVHKTLIKCGVLSKGSGNILGPKPFILHMYVCLYTNFYFYSFSAGFPIMLNPSCLWCSNFVMVGRKSGLSVFFNFWPKFIFIYFFRCQ